MRGLGITRRQLEDHAQPPARAALGLEAPAQARRQAAGHRPAPPRLRGRPPCGPPRGAPPHPPPAPAPPPPPPPPPAPASLPCPLPAPRPRARRRAAS